MNNTTYFQEKLETLPDYVRWSIEETDYVQELETIKKKYRLHIDQSATLETLCQQFILGDIDPTGFVESLFHDGKVSYQMAGDILVEINTTIIEKIKQRIEKFKDEEREVEEMQKTYLNDAEKEIEEINTIYAQQDNEYVKVVEEVEKEIKANGGDLSEEDMAHMEGVTPAQYLANKRNTAEPTLKTATLDISATTPTETLQSEKEDILKELEQPQKSFSSPIFKVIKPTPPVVEEKVTPPDHQLENTHIEEPIHAETPVAPQPVKAEQTPKPPIQPIITKPAKIEISHDIYREPIE